jgi:hypothetical protein
MFRIYKILSWDLSLPPLTRFKGQFTHFRRKTSFNFTKETHWASQLLQKNAQKESLTLIYGTVNSILDAFMVEKSLSQCQKAYDLNKGIARYIQ